MIEYKMSILKILCLSVFILIANVDRTMYKAGNSALLLNVNFSERDKCARFS